MGCDVEFKESVFHDLKKLDKSEAKRILNAIDKKLGADPDTGIPLAGQFKGLFKFRVGDYRVIYSKTVRGVLILRIAHRKNVYKQDV